MAFRLKSYLQTSLLVLTALLTCAGSGSEPAQNERPKVGLVLSGGGARGAAHVGVLKVLERLNIPVDYVAGTSMGAIVGGLYASGMSIDELDSVMNDTDWNTFYSDRQPRAERSLRRKSDGNGFLVNFDMGFKDGGLVFPLGLVQGQKFEIALRRWLLPVAKTKDFDALPIPFRAVATDVATGELIVLDSGDLASAIRASMSAPGALKPVRLNGRLLVDGGLVNNLPVQIVQDMGADVLIVVDVGFPLLNEEDLDSVLSVSNQMLTIMIKGNASRQLNMLGDDDILITPELDRLSSAAFDRMGEAVQIGEASASKLEHELKSLTLGHTQYAAHRQNKSARRFEPPVIDQVKIVNQSLLSPRVIATRLSDHEGKPLDVEQLESEIGEIYGFDTFESVTYSVNDVDDKTELLLTAKEKSWGPNYLRFGVNFEDDFDGTSNYNLAARLTKTEINKLGGELRLEAQMGTSPRLFAEWYQPLDYRSRWFVSSSLEYGNDNDILFDRGTRLAQFRSEQAQFSLTTGRQFGNWGQLVLGVSQIRSDASLQIGMPLAGDFDSDIRAATLVFDYDTVDNDSIPRFGTQSRLQWIASREGMGSDASFDLAQFSILKPYTWGKNTLLNWWDFGSVTKGDLAPFSIGGLFSLSGYASEELQAKHVAIGRLLYYRRLGDAKLPVFDTTVYVGASIEMGNVWESRTDISFDSALTAGSLFVVLDTLIGPVYLAYGSAEGGRSSAYLFIGQTF